MHAFIAIILSLNVVCGALNVLKQIRTGKHHLWISHMVFESLWVVALLGHVGMLT